MRTIFFYGLFMDDSLLTKKALHPAVVGPAVLRGFRIHVGERATLVKSESDQAYGMVMDLDDEEANALYSEPSVREYTPERVRVQLLNTKSTVNAWCYNLPPDVGIAGTNPDYARTLSELLAKLGFDPAYVAEVASFSRQP